MLGKNHPDITISHNNLAVMYFEQKYYKTAVAYSLKAYKIFILKFGFCDPDTLMFCENLKEVYAEWNPVGDF